MNLSITGLPAIAITVGFLLVFAAPVWMAAKLVGAHTPTLLRSILALLLGMVGTIVSAAIAGTWALLLAPLSYILSFKFVLGTTFLQAILLSMLALVGYAAMLHFIGGGMSVSESGISI